MESLGFEPGAAGWKVQKKPRSYGGHPKNILTYLLKLNMISTLDIFEVN